MAEIRVSELPAAGILQGTDLVMVAQENSSSASGYISNKTTTSALADKINNSLTYNGLNTTAKTIVGAINENKANEVEANPQGTASTSLTKIKVGNNIYSIDDTGSIVSVFQTLSSGTEIGSVTVDGNETKLFAPTPTTVEANPAGTGSTDLTKLNVGGTIYNIPSGGGSGDTVAWNQIQQSGTKIATITINSTPTDVYAPNGGGGASALEDLTDVTITTPSDNQDLSYDSTSSKWINKTKQVSLTKAQYDALPSSKLTDGIQYFITDMNVINGYTDLIGTLTAGNTTLTISDELITIDSTFDIYTSVYGVNPANVVASTGSITLTFEAQQSDLGVKVRLSTDRAPSDSRNGNGNVTINSSTIVDISQVI